jgi:hypothetical protein
MMDDLNNNQIAKKKELLNIANSHGGNTHGKRQVTKNCWFLKFIFSQACMPEHLLHVHVQTLHLHLHRNFCGRSGHWHQSASGISTKQRSGRLLNGSTEIVSQRLVPHGLGLFSFINFFIEQLSFKVGEINSYV